MSRKTFVNCSLSYKQWGSPSSAKKVLAIHGWLDNANSFNFLGPYLADRGFHVVAYDNIGHGYSSHETASSNNYTMAPYVSRCRDMVDSLKWEKCNIVGHSLGASLTTVFSGTYPETVERIALIDGFATPMTQPAERAAANLRRAIDSERNYNLRQLAKSGPKKYDTLQDAILARMKSVSSYPGKQFLSIEAASALVARGVSLADYQSNIPRDQHDVSELTDLSAGPVVFRHDNRLFLPGHVHFSKHQLKSFIEAITAKTLLITAANGWPAGNTTDHLEYLAILQSKGLLTDLHLPGSHHLHLDPDYASHTAEAIASHLLAAEEYVDGEASSDASA